jgi:hypothetical protein
MSFTEPGPVIYINCPRSAEVQDNPADGYLHIKLNSNGAKVL